MEKRVLSLLLTLLLFLGAAGAARADNTIIVNLGTAEAGAYADRLLGTTERGVAAISGGTLPEGCRIETETREDGACHYLRGTPMIAGDYAFTLVVAAPAEGASAEENTDGEEKGADNELELIADLRCSLTVLPATPSVSVSPDVSVDLGGEASLTAVASAADGGALSYQWYAAASRTNVDGTALPDAAEATLRVTPQAAGTSWYYCVVTNTNNGRTAAEASPAAAVTAEQVVPVSLTVLSMPAKLDFTVGDRLDTTGLQLRLTWSNGQSETIGAGFTAEPSKLSETGSQTVTVNYAGLSCSYNVQVKEIEEVVLDLQVVDLPKKLDYKVGEWLDTTGLTLRVDTNKGSYDVSTGYTCNPRVLEQEGRQTITVNYGSNSVTFTVNVAGAEKHVESITVLRRPAKLSYTVGDAFDPLGLTLMVTTNQGSEEVTEGFTWEPQRFTSAGRQNVTIRYEGQSCELELIVDAPAETAAPGESAAPTAEPEPSPAATPRPNVSVERKSGQTAVTVIVVAALVGLAALLGYVYLAKRDQVRAALRAIRERLGKRK